MITSAMLVVTLIVSIVKPFHLGSRPAVYRYEGTTVYPATNGDCLKAANYAAGELGRVLARQGKRARVQASCTEAVTRPL